MDQLIRFFFFLKVNKVNDHKNEKETLEDMSSRPLAKMSYLKLSLYTKLGEIQYQFFF